MNVIIYARVSTIIQDVKRQEEELQEFCKRNNYNVINVIQEKISGKVSWKDRELRRIVELENDKVDGILIWELSRLGRGTQDVLEVISIFNEKKIWIYSLKENIRTLDENLQKVPTTDLLLTVLSGISELERNTIVERSLSGLKKAVNDGKWLGGKYTPYGYKRENKRLIIDDEEKKVIEMIFSLYMKDYGSKRIANKLNELHIQTRFNKDVNSIKINGVIKEGKDFKWKDGTIYSILTNPLYINEKYITGKLKGLKLEVPQMIDKRLFESVQHKLKHTQKRTSVKYFYPLEQKITCGVCVYNYFPHKRANLKDNAYKCLSIRYNDNCGNYGIGITKLNAGVWTTLRINQGEIENILRINQNKLEYQKEIQTLKEFAKEVRSELSKYKNREIKIVSLFLDGNINNDVLTKKNEEIKTKIKQLEKQIESIENEILSKEDFIEKQYDATNSLRRIKDSKYILKKTFKKMIDKVVIYPVEKHIFNDIYTNKQDKLVFVELYTFLNINLPLCFVISQRSDTILFPEGLVKYDKGKKILFNKSALYEEEQEEEEEEYNHRKLIFIESLK
jgi:DNA invertase Pin-like site-specific DNA recombinase